MVDRSRLFAILWFIAVAVLLPVGCSCDDDDDDDDAVGDDDTDDDDDDADDDAADDDASGCGTADMWPGTWIAGVMTMEIAGDLTYHTTGSAQMNYAVDGFIEVDGCTAWFTDTGGEGACPLELVGEYGFVVTESTLTTSLESDPCAGRANGLDGMTFERQS